MRRCRGRSSGGSSSDTKLASGDPDHDVRRCEGSHEHLVTGGGGSDCREVGDADRQPVSVPPNLIDTCQDFPQNGGIGVARGSPRQRAGDVGGIDLGETEFQSRARSLQGRQPADIAAAPHARRRRATGRWRPRYIAPSAAETGRRSRGASRRSPGRDTQPGSGFDRCPPFPGRGREGTGRRR